MSTYTVTEFSRIIGVSVKSLQRWDREGILVPNRTPTNRRTYTDDHLAQALGISRTKQPRLTVGYARVSSNAQKPDLQNQLDCLKQFALGKGVVVNEWISEVGGGMNFKRKGFLKLVDLIVTGRVERVIVAHRDRLVRFGFDLIKHLCEVQNCELVVLENQDLSPEQEMVQDLTTIVHCFSSRLYGLRNYRKSIQQALSGNDIGA